VPREAVGERHAETVRAHGQAGHRAAGSGAAIGRGGL